MMHNRPLFSEATVLAKMAEAEQLAATIRAMASGDERDMTIFRWGIVADETSALITLAEEILPPDDLERLRSRINLEGSGRWQAFRYGGRRIKTLTGKELWEHPRLDLTLGQLLDEPPIDE